MGLSDVQVVGLYLDECADSIHAQPCMPDRLSCFGKIDVAGLRQHHPPSRESEYVRAQLLIDVLDLFTNSGFADAKIFTRCFERTLLSHCKNRNLPVHSDI
jgi:hypothetical protein